MHEELRDAGLQDGEIKVYLALLKIGDATASAVTKNTGLHRSNVYDILEKLMGKGIVSFVIKNNVKYFRASHPRRLVDFLKEKEENLATVIPELLRQYTRGKEECVVEIYKGIEGIKTVLNDIVKERRDYLLFGRLEFERLLPVYVKQFVRQVNELKITERAILESGTAIVETERRAYRYISRGYLFPNAVIVYGNKVAIFVWQDPYNIILIQNKDTATSYRKHFEILWRIAKEG